MGRVTTAFGTGATLRSYLSRLRGALPADLAPVVRRPAGYTLLVEESAVDLWRFRRSAERAAELLEHDPDSAIQSSERALALWPDVGEPLPGWETPWARELRTTLEREHVDAALIHH